MYIYISIINTHAIVLARLIRREGCIDQTLEHMSPLFFPFAVKMIIRNTGDEREAKVLLIKAIDCCFFCTGSN